MDAFRIDAKVGEGTYGEVFRARRIQDGRVVALKKIRVRRLTEGIPDRVLREVQSLQRLQQQTGVLRLFDVFPSGSSVVLAVEYMETDLFRLSRRLVATQQRRWTVPEVKSLMRMLLRGVMAVHSWSLMHRDLKPANLLFAPSGVLKIGDFGLARVHATGPIHEAAPPAKTGPRTAFFAEAYSHEVATRWYRAPELLFGARHYATGVDMWAVGCIFGELLLGTPLFPGENDIDQLFRIFSVLGTPTEAPGDSAMSWPGVTALPDYHKISFKTMKRQSLSSLIEAPPSALDLLEQLLVYDPEVRVSAHQALMHSFFWTGPRPVHPSHFCRFFEKEEQEDNTATWTFASMGLLE